MSFSNSYIRAFIVCVLIFIAAVFRMFQRYGSDWNNRHAMLVLAILGFALVLTGLLVGTFSRRSEKPWPWWKVGVASLGCWLAVLGLMLLIQERFYLR